MKQHKTILFFAILLAGIGAVGAYALAEQADIQAESVALFGKENAKVLYVKGKELTTLDFGLRKIENSLDANGYHKKVYLSPDRKFVAVTFEPNEEDVFTYITDVAGNTVVEPQIGSFISWSPDSTKVLLYLSSEKSGDGRYIYYLGTDGTYVRSGLPKGVISADISPVDGSIVYSLTESGTDKSHLYIRTPQGEDKLLLKGEDNIFAWVRWAPQGDKVAFLKSDLYLSGNANEVWIANPDGTNAQRISSIMWSYPPMWAPDSSRIVFANGGNVWEYDVIQNELQKRTENGRSARHPSYSADGETVVFSDDSQIFGIRDDIVTQIVDGGGDKTYPFLP